MPRGKREWIEPTPLRPIAQALIELGVVQLPCRAYQQALAYYLLSQDLAR